QAENIVYRSFDDGHHGGARNQRYPHGGSAFHPCRPLSARPARIIPGFPFQCQVNLKIDTTRALLYPHARGESQHQAFFLPSFDPRSNARIIDHRSRKMKATLLLSLAPVLALAAVLSSASPAQA